MDIMDSMDTTIQLFIMKVSNLMADMSTTRDTFCTQSLITSLMTPMMSLLFLTQSMPSCLPLLRTLSLLRIAKRSGNSKSSSNLRVQIRKRANRQLQRHSQSKSESRRRLLNRNQHHLRNQRISSQRNIESQSLMRLLGNIMSASCTTLMLTTGVR